MLPLDYQMQLCLGVLDLVLGLYIQHVSRVFPIDQQDNVATLQVCFTCFAALNDLFHSKNELQLGLICLRLMNHT